MSSNGTKRRNLANQTGMVSIMVTMIMMLVISLIVLGFAQISRREQRQSLDRQLSSQAFFAAESGINDARKIVNAALAAGTPIVEKDTCDPKAPYIDNPKIDSTNNVSYTCLLVTSKLNNIRRSLTAGAGSDSAKIPLEPDGGTIATIHVNWTAQTNPTPPQVGACQGNVLPNDSFPKNAIGGWNCPFGVLRMDIVPTDTLSRAALASGQKTVFLYPTKGGGGGSIDYAVSDGAVTAMRCNSGPACDIDITNMISSGSTNYALRLTALYKDGTAVITASDASGASLFLKNAQVQVDATGKAQDVLRRVQVRLPMAIGGKTPDYAIESASSICKRFEISINSFGIPGDIKGQDQKNPMCVSAIVPPPCVIVPHDIVIAADTSESMGDLIAPGVSRRDKLVELLNKFVLQTVGPTNHESIIGFSGMDNRGPIPIDNRITTYLPLTTSLPNLQSTINTLPVRFGTLFLPPLNQAQTAYGQGAFQPSADKVLVFLSDGEDTSGNLGAILAKTDQLKAPPYNTTIYTIGIGNSANFGILQLMASSQSKFGIATDVIGFETIMNQIIYDLGCK